MYLSDKMRVEIVLPAQVMMAVVMAGVAEKNAKYDACIRNLVVASSEGVRDLPDKKQAKILDRVRRLHHEVVSPFIAEGGEVVRFGLISFFWIKALVESGYLVFAEDSAISLALDIYMDAIEHRAKIPAARRSAEKQAAKFLTHLQSLGYYAGVTFTPEPQTITLDDVVEVRVAQ